MQDLGLIRSTSGTPLLYLWAPTLVFLSVVLQYRVLKASYRASLAAAAAEQGDDQDDAAEVAAGGAAGDAKGDRAPLTGGRRVSQSLCGVTVHADCGFAFSSRDPARPSTQTAWTLRSVQFL